MLNLEMLCGNLYNSYHDRWTLFVKFKDQAAQAKGLIKKVEYQFSDGARQESSHGPYFTVKGHGDQGNNMVIVSVFFNDQYGIPEQQLVHQLFLN